MRVRGSSQETFFVTIRKENKAGKRLPRTSLQSQGCPSENFGDSPIQTENIGKIRAQQSRQSSGQQRNLQGIRTVNHEQLARTKEINGTLKIVSLKTVHIRQRLRSQRKQISKVLEYTL